MSGREERGCGEKEMWAEGRGAWNDELQEVKGKR